MCKEGDLVLYRELPSCNPEVNFLHSVYNAFLTEFFPFQGDTPESHVPSVAYTHWMCVTDRARILLRKEPQRMAYHYSLGQEDIDAVEADIAKARSKRKLAEYEPTSDDERRIENERADRRAEKRRARDEAYGAAFKNKKKWGRIRRNWEKRQKEIGSNATWQDDYRGLAEELWLIASSDIFGMVLVWFIALGRLSWHILSLCNQAGAAQTSLPTFLVIFSKSASFDSVFHFLQSWTVHFDGHDTLWFLVSNIKILACTFLQNLIPFVYFKIICVIIQKVTYDRDMIRWIL